MKNFLILTLLLPLFLTSCGKTEEIKNIVNMPVMQKQTIATLPIMESSVVVTESIIKSNTGKIEEISTRDVSGTGIIDTQSESPKQIAFDGCGKIEKYVQEPWYNDFAQKLGENKQQMTTIADICQSLDKTLVIALFQG